jgi:hypothetical protein
VLDGALAVHAALGVEHTHLMTFTAPVDADVEGVDGR